MTARPSFLRSRLRRIARRLPTRTQIWLKDADARLRQSDWAESVEQLRRHEQTFIDETAARNQGLPERQRVLLLTLQSSPPGTEIECSLAMALALRGHDVRGILCDGLLPICEMNLGAVERPPCATCIGWRARYSERAFGFRWPRVTRYLTTRDRDEAEALVTRVPSEQWPALTLDGIAIGRFARRELQRYRRGFVFNYAADPAFRDWLVSGILLARLLSRVLEVERPDVVVTSSGRTLASACLLEVARVQGIRSVTWDTEPTFPDGLVFSHGRPAVEVPLDDAWRDAGVRSLTADERNQLHVFLGRWARSENTPFPYNPHPLEDEGELRARLGIRPGTPLVVAFTNTGWDMAVVDRDVGFADMFEWVFTLVDYAVAHPDISLIVRAHPAEVQVPLDLQSTTPVVAEIQKRYPELPPNVHLIEGSSPFSSYALASMSDVVMVYASRIGLEVALAGKRPWLCGDVTYRGKGFTRDIQSKAELIARLDSRVFEETLSSDEIARAERFAHLWFFHGVVRVPLLRPSRRPFALRSFRDLAPGGEQAIEHICDAIASGQPFVTGP